MIKKIRINRGWLIAVKYGKINQKLGIFTGG